MKIQTFIAACAIALAAGCMDAAAQRGIHNPMTQAVLAVYEEELQANPNNYTILLNRAEEYFRHQEFVRSMADLNRALPLIPANQKEPRLHALMLRAGIFNQTGHPQQAFDDLVDAERLAPTNLGVLIQKANTELELGKNTEAKADYQRILRLNPRTAEAFIGLARVAVNENNMGLAAENLESAVNINPNNPDTYLRRSSVRKAMGDHNGAVEDLVLALSVDPDNSLAMEGLVAYGDTNYPAVMAGLSSAVTAAPQVGMYRYLRAGIAQAHYNYLAALDDYKALIDQRLYDYHGIYASIAECEFALCRFDDAINNIDYALNRVQDGNTCKYYTLRSRILRALGRYDEAVHAAANATMADRGSGDALAELALAYTAVGRYEDASSLLGEATMNDAENPRYPMLRAWIQEKFLNNPEAAAVQYRKVVELDMYMADQVASLKGFALLFLGETDQAKRWMENILANTTDYDGRTHYLATCFYGLLNDDQKAFECASKALDLGYGNYFDWTENKDGRINDLILRDDLRFLHLIAQHNAMFGL